MLTWQTVDTLDQTNIREQTYNRYNRRYILKYIVNINSIRLCCNVNTQSLFPKCLTTEILFRIWVEIWKNIDFWCFLVIFQLNIDLCILFPITLAGEHVQHFSVSISDWHCCQFIIKIQLNNWCDDTLDTSEQKGVWRFTPVTDTLDQILELHVFL